MSIFQTLIFQLIEKMHCYRLLLISLLSLGLFACKEEPKANSESTPIVRSEDYTLSWEVKNEWSPDRAQAFCTFTLQNQSDQALGQDWVLYFSQFPRGIREPQDPGQFTVEHISGDWHKLTPGADFQLAAGETASLTYEMGGPILKETDAALGPYLVLLDENGNEETIHQFAQYDITTPDWMEQAADRNDLPIEVPDAGHRYGANQMLRTLDADQLSPIIPTPVSAQMGEAIQLDSSWPIHHEEATSEAELLAQQLSQLIGGDFSVQEGGGPEAGIFLSVDASQPVEGYQLEITDTRIDIKGGSPAGIFYGCQSLLQLIPLNDLQEKDGAAMIPSGKISDAPRFGYRGFHLDLGRNFQEKASLLKVIDLIASYKINRLQLCLSEDEGWRLEIEELPELTEVASKRGHTLTEDNHLHPAYGSGPSVDNSHGSGYYTREEYKEIIRYAHERHVQVIPTFNFPAHARAAIVAMEARYQRLMAEGNAEAADEFRLIDPADTSRYYSAQGYHDNVVNVSRASTYRFYETVVDDVIEMYEEAEVPFTFFHTGGDEVPNGAWAGSPENMALLESLPDIDDPRNLQVHYFNQAVKMLNERNLMIGGWEEVALEKGTDGFVINDAYADQNVVPYVWNTLGDALNLGYRLANAGYPVVICNVQDFYFDLAYDPSPEEPGLYWGGFVKTQDAWSFAPFDLVSGLPDNDPRRKTMEDLKPDAKDNILGLQAQLWSETLKGNEMMEYYLLPKLFGFAERAWSQGEWEKETAIRTRNLARDVTWNQFANALGQRELPKMAHWFAGYNYRIPLPGAIQIGEQVHANVAFPGLEIRYTTDGSEPTADSPFYDGPINASGEIRLRSFDAAGNHSRTVRVK